MKITGFLSKLTCTLMLPALALGCLAACGESAQEPEENTEAAYGWTQSVYSSGGADVEYQVYVPEAYVNNSTAELPLITYVPDASYVNASWTQYLKSACPLNWATEEKMSKNPAFFLLIRFTETTTSLGGSQGALVNALIDKVVADYNIDTDRLYLTGQSMGGILDWALNDAYPDKFAATVYVGCQPGGDVRDEQYNTIIDNAAFASQKFVYIASRKDEKAPYGQDDVQAALDAAGSSYDLLYDLDHTDNAALNAVISAELAKDYDRFFFGYTQLTSNGDGVAEHMQSFKYAYQIDAVFEWLMAQSK
ncbi:MAG: PHB depolymerase family esterase [Candidatus Coproplasma sp.]